MKLLKEDFGESEELNTFVYQAQRRFNTFYIVTLKVKNSVSNKYFAYEEAAKKYYDNLMKEAKNNAEYYDGSEISWDKVTVNLDYDEQDFSLIDSTEDDINIDNEE